MPVLSSSPSGDGSSSQTTCKFGLLSPVLTTFLSAQWPTFAPARLSPPFQFLLPRSHPLKSVPGCPWDSTSHRRASHRRGHAPLLHHLLRPRPDDIRRGRRRLRQPPSRTPGPRRPPPSPSASRPLWRGPGGRAPPTRRPPAAHLFLLLLCSPGPHPRRAPASGAPHSPRVGLLRHGAGSAGSAAGSGRARRRRRRGTHGRRARSGRERKARPGPGARSLARSLARTAGGRAAGEGAGGERPGSEAAPLPGPRGGAGSALGLPHRRRRRRLRCGSKPNMAAAAAARRTRGPRGGRTARGPRAHCALGRGSAALGRRRRRPGDMAGGWRRRRRRQRRQLRGALGGEVRPLGSHPPRGGRRGRGRALARCGSRAQNTLT